MSVDRQELALIALVEADRDAQCAAIGAEAAAAAAQIVRKARAAARERSRAALADERRRRAQQLGAIAARLANAQRQHEQQSHAALLALAWQRLPELLARRWSVPDSRADWIDHVFAAARAALPAGEWTVVHGPGLADADRRQLAALAAEAGVTIREQLAPAQLAGIKLRAGGNVVDGTAAGLLADRAAIGSRLLDHLQEPT